MEEHVMHKSSWKVILDPSHYISQTDKNKIDWFYSILFSQAAARNEIIWIWRFHFVMKKIE